MKNQTFTCCVCLKGYVERPCYHLPEELENKIEVIENNKVVKQRKRKQNLYCYNCGEFLEETHKKNTFLKDLGVLRKSQRKLSLDEIDLDSSDDEAIGYTSDEDSKIDRNIIISVEKVKELFNYNGTECFHCKYKLNIFRQYFEGSTLVVVLKCHKDHLYEWRIDSITGDGCPDSIKRMKEFKILCDDKDISINVDIWHITGKILSKWKIIQEKKIEKPKNKKEMIEHRKVCSICNTEQQLLN
eukprot:gene3370-5917_t